MACYYSLDVAGRHLPAISGSRPLKSRHSGWIVSKSSERISGISYTTHLNIQASAAGSRNAANTTNRSSAASTVVERRAADVAVIGNSGVAYAAAYSLARRGKKVVFLPDLGFAAHRPRPEVHRPLHLPHPDPAMVSFIAEAAAYWRGLQAQAAGSGQQLLAETRSLDVGPLRRSRAGSATAAAVGQHVAEEALERLTGACKVAGVRLGSLRGEELSGLFPPVRLLGEEVGLLQPEGGVLDSSAAHRLLLHLGDRQGVMLRDRLVLRGWRDAGSYFVLRASGRLAPEAVSVLEVEQVLLAPEDWPGHVLRMFGCGADLQVVQSSFARCLGTAELTSLPVWRLFGTAPPPTTAGEGGTGSANSSSDLPPQMLVATGVTSRPAEPNSGSVSVKLGISLTDEWRAVNATHDGVTRGFDPWTWQPGNPDREGLLIAHRLSRRLLRGIGPLVTPPAPLSVPEPRGREIGQSPQDAPGQWGEVGLHISTPDGWPVLGFLPGWEQGRILFACTASCSSQSSSSGGVATAASNNAISSSPKSLGKGGDQVQGSRSDSPLSLRVDLSPINRISQRDASSRGDGHVREEQQQQQQQHPLKEAAATEGWHMGGRPVLHDGYQLNPLVAKMAVDLLCGAVRTAEVDLERVDLNRPPLAACMRMDGGFDPWDGLERWQDGSAFREAAEAARIGALDGAEAREKAEAVARGAKMLGRDAAGLEEETAREEVKMRRGREPKVFTTWEAL